MLASSRPRALVLGASGYYCPAIAALQNAGFWVGAVDRNPRAPGLELADAGEAVDIVAMEDVRRMASAWRVDVIAPVNDFGVPTSAEVSAYLGLPGIGPQTARLCTNKHLMRLAWERAGLPNPGFALVGDRNEFERAIERLGLPCICKPADSRGGGSRGIMVVEHPADLDKAFEFALAYAGKQGVLVERFVSGLEHSCEVFLHAGQAEVLALGDKIKTPLPYRVDKDVLYPSMLEPQQLTAAERMACEAALALGLDNGIAHVELCTTKEGTWLFELGARPGGGHTSEVILPYLRNVHEFVLYVQALMGIGDVPPPFREPRAAAYHFLTPAAGVFERVEGLEVAAARKEVLDCGVFLESGQEIKPVRVGGDRAGFVVTGCQSRDEALAIARQVESDLHFIYRVN